MDTETFITKLRTVLTGTEGLELVVLVGSRARGDAREAADIDLLVHVDPKTLSALASIHDRVCKAFGRPVDVLTLSTVARFPHSVAWVVSEGRVVIDRRGLWPRICADPDVAVQEAGDELLVSELATLEHMRVAERLDQQRLRYADPESAQGRD